MIAEEDWFVDHPILGSLFGVFLALFIGAGAIFFVHSSAFMLDRPILTVAFAVVVAMLMGAIGVSSLQVSKSRHR